MAEGNVLYYGDNLDVLRRHVRDESVDLVYLDPPFNSNADYNILFNEHGEKAAAQVQAFTDTWTWDTDARADYEEVVESGAPVANAMRAFYTMLGGSDMMAYLSRMSLRLTELHRVLRDGGSLYLHCDPTASHYLKLLLDAVFGPKNFRNEIIWHYRRWTNAQGQFQKMHDVLLFYRKGKIGGTFHLMMVDPTESQAAVIARGWNVNKVKQGDGKILQLLVYDRTKLEAAVAAGVVDLSKYGRVVYRDETKSASSDVWTDIQYLHSQALERLGYPTQKPVALLERVVAASSNPGDVVLDPFCGCGTTIDAAQAMGRRWIGIDITHLSIGLIKHRLTGRYGATISDSYRVVGEPTTVEDAAVLAREDPFQFQAWALGLVGARVAGSDKKGGDKGIDGRLLFHDSVNGPTRQIIFSVKAGHVAPTFVDALWGVIQREKAEIGVLISFNEPTAGMRARAAEAGFYESPWGRHPRLQLRTIGELLGGKGIDYPHVTGANVTHRRATRVKAAEPESLELFGKVAEDDAEYSN